MNLPFLYRAAARLLDLRGAFYAPVTYVYRRVENNRSGWKRDDEAFASDWRAVSSDVASTIERIRTEYPETRRLPVQRHTAVHSHAIVRRRYNHAKDPIAVR